MDKMSGMVSKVGRVFPKFYEKIQAQKERLEKGIIKKQEELAELNALLQEGDEAIRETMNAGVQLSLWGPEGPVQEEETINA